MTTLSNEDLVVARRPGTRLFLGKGISSHPAFGGLSERTIFFANDTVEKELKALRVPPETVELMPAKLSAVVG